MTIQRITNHHSAPISACLRAFVLAAGTGIASNSRPNSRPYTTTNMFGSQLGMNMFKGSNCYPTPGNSATLRGSA
jgi:hypothetical protein